MASTQWQQLHQVATIASPRMPQGDQTPTKSQPQNPATFKVCPFQKSAAVYSGRERFRSVPQISQNFSRSRKYQQHGRKVSTFEFGPEAFRSIPQTLPTTRNSRFERVGGARQLIKLIYYIFFLKLPKTWKKRHFFGLSG